ncbi:hypothetical protein [Lysobacter sp. Root983]|uniref:hypothetical protein n=1 Tax=Lysobacter sp. Root983 TaxID=1736613 RepID=UPI0012F8963A|nr:hypothetical protein [Lysobacter sp. Root983]
MANIILNIYAEWQGSNMASHTHQSILDRLHALDLLVYRRKECLDDTSFRREFEEVAARLITDAASVDPHTLEEALLMIDMIIERSGRQSLYNPTKH